MSSARRAGLYGGHERRSAVRVVNIGAPTATADLSVLCDRLRLVLRAGDAELVMCDVGALGVPDAGTVDGLARLALTARRLGARVRLLNACGELQELIALTGLAQVVPCGAELGVEVSGQPEEREELLRVEEERDPADPSA